MLLKQMAASDRPREKFMTLGATACSNSELLAILLGNGTQGESVVDLTRRILADCNNSITTLQQRSLQQLQEYKGVGPAKAITIMAAAELARRCQAEDIGERPVITASIDLQRYFAPRMAHLPHEEVYALYLNNNNQVICHEQIGRGGLSDASIDVRLVIRGVLMQNATGVALCHNHPSGNLLPSAYDDKITAQLAEACRTMRIRLVDHIIVTEGNKYYSYSDHGKI